MKIVIELPEKSAIALRKNSKTKTVRFKWFLNIFIYSN
jgi:hypothetical protein